MTKKKKLLLVMGGIVLIPLVLFALVWTILNVVWGAELRAELAAAKEAGAPMTMEDLVVKIPADKNAAKECRQLFAITTDGSFSSRESGDLSAKWLAVENMFDAEFPSAEFEENCRKKQADLRALFDSSDGRRFQQLAREAATKQGLDLQLNYQDGPAMLMPHLGRLRSCVRILCVKAQLDLLEGKRDQGWETIITILGFNKLLMDDPIIISQLVLFAVDRMVYNFTCEYVSKYGIETSQAETLLALLDSRSERCRAQMKRGVQGDRVMLGGWVFDKLMQGKLSQEVSDGMGIDQIRFVPSSLLKPLTKKNYAVYIRFMRQYETEYDRPFTEVKADVPTVSTQIKCLPFYCPLVKLLAPSLDRCREQVAQVSTKSVETRTRLALEIYKNKHGQYPNDLQTLVPGILSKTPSSYLTGKPFQYEKTEKGYTLTSE